jgi:uncharacterized protein YdhG (YjbR/CyaY superfamily)
MRENSMGNKRLKIIKNLFYNIRMEMKNYKNIDEYICDYPDNVQEILQKIRNLISKEIPGGEEAIKYGIPTFRLNGKNMVHFGGYKNHIGFYPAPRAIEKFKDELAKYEGGKGTVQFPLDKPIPYDLIKRIVQFRVTEST